MQVRDRDCLVTARVVEAGALVLVDLDLWALDRGLVVELREGRGVQSTECVTQEDYVGDVLHLPSAQCRGSLFLDLREI